MNSNLESLHMKSLNKKSIKEHKAEDGSNILVDISNEGVTIIPAEPEMKQNPYQKYYIFDTNNRRRLEKRIKRRATHNYGQSGQTVFSGRRNPFRGQNNEFSQSSENDQMHMGEITRNEKDISQLAPINLFNLANNKRIIDNKINLSLGTEEKYIKELNHEISKLKYDNNNENPISLKRGFRTRRLLNKRKSRRRYEDTNESEESEDYTKESREKNRETEEEDETGTNEDSDTEENTHESNEDCDSRSCGGSRESRENYKRTKIVLLKRNKLRNICPENGYFPDFRSCRKFYICTGNKVTYYKCNKNSFVYSSFLKSCIPGNNKHCTNFNCNRNKRGFVPFERDPQIYVTCRRNKPSAIHKCPSGFVFLGEKQGCKELKKEISKPSAHNAFIDNTPLFADRPVTRKPYSNLPTPKSSREILKTSSDLFQGSEPISRDTSPEVKINLATAVTESGTPELIYPTLDSSLKVTNYFSDKENSNTPNISSYLLSDEHSLMKTQGSFPVENNEDVTSSPVKHNKIDSKPLVVKEGEATTIYELLLKRTASQSENYKIDKPSDELIYNTETTHGKGEYTTIVEEDRKTPNADVGVNLPQVDINTHSEGKLLNDPKIIKENTKEDFHKPAEIHGNYFSESPTRLPSSYDRSNENEFIVPTLKQSKIDGSVLSLSNQPINGESSYIWEEESGHESHPTKTSKIALPSATEFSPMIYPIKSEILDDNMAANRKIKEPFLEKPSSPIRDSFQRNPDSLISTEMKDDTQTSDTYSINGNLFNGVIGSHLSQLEQEELKYKEENLDNKDYSDSQKSGTSGGQIISSSSSLNFYNITETSDSSNTSQLLFKYTPKFEKESHEVIEKTKHHPGVLSVHNSSNNVSPPSKNVSKNLFHEFKLTNTRNILANETDSFSESESLLNKHEVFETSGQTVSYEAINAVGNVTEDEQDSENEQEKDVVLSPNEDPLGRKINNFKLTEFEQVPLPNVASSKTTNTMIHFSHSSPINKVTVPIDIMFSAPHYKSDNSDHKLTQTSEPTDVGKPSLSYSYQWGESAPQDTLNDSTSIINTDSRPFTNYSLSSGVQSNNDIRFYEQQSISNSTPLPSASASPLRNINVAKFSSYSPPIIKQTLPLTTIFTSPYNASAYTNHAFDVTPKPFEIQNTDLPRAHSQRNNTTFNQTKINTQSLKGKKDQSSSLQDDLADFQNVTVGRSNFNNSSRSFNERLNLSTLSEVEQTTPDSLKVSEFNKTLNSVQYQMQTQTANLTREIFNESVLDSNTEKTPGTFRQGKPSETNSLLSRSPGIYSFSTPNSTHTNILNPNYSSSPQSKNFLTGLRNNAEKSHSFVSNEQINNSQSIGEQYNALNYSQFIESSTSVSNNYKTAHQEADKNKTTFPSDSIPPNIFYMSINNSSEERHSNENFHEGTVSLTTSTQKNQISTYSPPFSESNTTNTETSSKHIFSYMFTPPPNTSEKNSSSPISSNLTLLNIAASISPLPDIVNHNLESSDSYTLPTPSAINITEPVSEHTRHFTVSDLFVYPNLSATGLNVQKQNYSTTPSYFFKTTPHYEVSSKNSHRENTLLPTNVTDGAPSISSVYSPSYSDNNFTTPNESFTNAVRNLSENSLIFQQPSAHTFSQSESPMMTAVMNETSFPDSSGNKTLHDYISSNISVELPNNYNNFTIPSYIFSSSSRTTTENSPTSTQIFESNFTRLVPRNVSETVQGENIKMTGTLNLHYNEYPLNENSISSPQNGANISSIPSYMLTNGTGTTSEHSEIRKKSIKSNSTQFLYQNASKNEFYISRNFSSSFADIFADDSNNQSVFFTPYSSENVSLSDSLNGKGSSKLNISDISLNDNVNHSTPLLPTKNGVTELLTKLISEPQSTSKTSPINNQSSSTLSVQSHGNSTEIIASQYTNFKHPYSSKNESLSDSMNRRTFVTSASTISNISSIESVTQSINNLPSQTNDGVTEQFSVSTGEHTSGKSSNIEKPNSPYTTESNLSHSQNIGSQNVSNTFTYSSRNESYSDSLNGNNPSRTTFTILSIPSNDIETSSTIRPTTWTKSGVMEPPSVSTFQPQSTSNQSSVNNQSYPPYSTNSTESSSENIGSQNASNRRTYSSQNKSSSDSLEGSDLVPSAFTISNISSNRNNAIQSTSSPSSRINNEVTEKSSVLVTTFTIASISSEDSRTPSIPPSRANTGVTELPSMITSQSEYTFNKLLVNKPSNPTDSTQSNGSRYEAIGSTSDSNKQPYSSKNESFSDSFNGNNPIPNTFTNSSISSNELGPPSSSSQNTQTNNVVTEKSTVLTSQLQHTSEQSLINKQTIPLYSSQSNESSYVVIGSRDISNTHPYSPQNESFSDSFNGNNPFSNTFTTSSIPSNNIGPLSSPINNGVTEQYSVLKSQLQHTSEDPPINKQINSPYSTPSNGSSTETIGPLSVSDKRPYSFQNESLIGNNSDTKTFTVSRISFNGSETPSSSSPRTDNGTIEQSSILTSQLQYTTEESRIHEQMNPPYSTQSNESLSAIIGSQGVSNKHTYFPQKESFSDSHNGNNPAPNTLMTSNISSNDISVTPLSGSLSSRSSEGVTEKSTVLADQISNTSEKFSNSAQSSLPHSTQSIESRSEVFGSYNSFYIHPQNDSLSGLFNRSTPVYDTHTISSIPAESVIPSSSSPPSQTNNGAIEQYSVLTRKRQYTSEEPPFNKKSNPLYSTRSNVNLSEINGSQSVSNTHPYSSQNETFSDSLNGNNHSHTTFTLSSISSNGIETSSSSRSPSVTNSSNSSLPSMIISQPQSTSNKPLVNKESIQPYSTQLNGGHSEIIVSQNTFNTQPHSVQSEFLSDSINRISSVPSNFTISSSSSNVISFTPFSTSPSLNKLSTIGNETFNESFKNMNTTQPIQRRKLTEQTSPIPSFFSLTTNSVDLSTATQSALYPQINYGTNSALPAFGSLLNSEESNITPTSVSNVTSSTNSPLRNTINNASLVSNSSLFLIYDGVTDSIIVENVTRLPNSTNYDSVYHSVNQSAFFPNMSSIANNNTASTNDSSVIPTVSGQMISNNQSSTFTNTTQYNNGPFIATKTTNLINSSFPGKSSGTSFNLNVSTTVPYSFFPNLYSQINNLPNTSGNENIPNEVTYSKKLNDLNESISFPTISAQIASKSPLDMISLSSTIQFEDFNEETSTPSTSQNATENFQNTARDNRESYVKISTTLLPSKSTISKSDLPSSVTYPSSPNTLASLTELTNFTESVTQSGARELRNSASPLEYVNSTDNSTELIMEPNVSEETVNPVKYFINKSNNVSRTSSTPSVLGNSREIEAIVLTPLGQAEEPVKLPTSHNDQMSQPSSSGTQPYSNSSYHESLINNDSINNWNISSTTPYSTKAASGNLANVQKNFSTILSPSLNFASADTSSPYPFNEPTTLSLNSTTKAFALASTSLQPTSLPYSESNIRDTEFRNNYTAVPHLFKNHSYFEYNNNYNLSSSKYSTTFKPRGVSVNFVEESTEATINPRANSSAFSDSTNFPYDFPKGSDESRNISESFTTPQDVIDSSHRNYSKDLTGSIPTGRDTHSSIDARSTSELPSSLTSRLISLSPESYTSTKNMATPANHTVTNFNNTEIQQSISEVTLPFSRGSNNLLNLTTVSPLLPGEHSYDSTGASAASKNNGTFNYIESISPTVSPSSTISSLGITEVPSEIIQKQSPSPGNQSMSSAFLNRTSLTNSFAESVTESVTRQDMKFSTKPSSTSSSTTAELQISINSTNINTSPVNSTLLWGMIGSSKTTPGISVDTVPHASSLKTDQMSTETEEGNTMTLNHSYLSSTIPKTTSIIEKGNFTKDFTNSSNSALTSATLTTASAENQTSRNEEDSDVADKLLNILLGSLSGFFF